MPENDENVPETYASLGDLLTVREMLDDLRSTVQQLTNALGVIQQNQAREIAVLEKLAERITGGTG